MTYPQGTAAAVIAAALAEVGTIEQGDNLTKYGKFTGADGLPWCGSFVNWCANEAGVKIPNMVSTAAGAQKIKDLGRWKEVPQVGDLCFMDFPHDGVDRISHIGIVAKVGLKSVLCIEFYVAPTELDDIQICVFIKMLPLWGIGEERVLLLAPEERNVNKERSE